MDCLGRGATSVPPTIILGKGMDTFYLGIGSLSFQSSWNPVSCPLFKLDDNNEKQFQFSSLIFKRLDFYDNMLPNLLVCFRIHFSVMAAFLDFF